MDHYSFLLHFIHIMPSGALVLPSYVCIPLNCYVYFNGQKSVELGYIELYHIGYSIIIFQLVPKVLGVSVWRMCWCMNSLSLYNCCYNTSFIIFSTSMIPSIVQNVFFYTCHEYKIRLHSMVSTYLYIILLADQPLNRTLKNHITFYQCSELFKCKKLYFLKLFGRTRKKYVRVPIQLLYCWCDSQLVKQTQKTNTLSKPYQYTQ